MSERIGDGVTPIVDKAVPLVLDLAAVGGGDLERAGGKGANLGELIRAGFPVPPGFVVTTAAYDRLVAENGLGAMIVAGLAEQDGGAIRAAFDRAQLPAELERAILAAYRALGGGAVAVRSSATAEDLPGAAFAGQQETFLGIVGEAALSTAVRRCFASLWSDRAIAYRARLGIDQATVKLAVIVQRLAAAEAAGVLFTANPISGARDETIVDASVGLGEAVVAGLVTPDHAVLRRGRWGWRVVERELGRREVVVRASAGGGTEQAAGTPATAPALPDRALRRLARLGARVERHFGRPQDIEWAWAGGRVYLVQARPITALPEEPPAAGLPRFAPLEYFQVRPYPLDMTTWTQAMGTAMARMIPLGRAMPGFDRLWVEEDGVVVGMAGWPGIRPSPDLALAPVRLARLALRYDPARWRDDPHLAEAKVRTHALNERDPRTLSWPELLAAVDEALAIPFAVTEIRRRYLPRAVLAVAGLRLLLGRLGRADRLGALLAGFENKTAEANRALEALAARVRADPDLAAAFARHEPDHLLPELERQPAGRTFLTELGDFLDRYGHRETVSPILVSAPTWRGEPAVVLGIVKGLAQGDPSSHGGTPAWEAARDEVLAHPALRLPPARSGFRRLLTAARRLLPLREDTHFYATMPLPALRETLLELGRRLVAAGVLDNAADVFHLRLEELRRIDGTWPPPPPLAAELRAVAQRRAERRVELADTPLFDRALLPRREPTGDVLLRGAPGSPGVVAGPVRVVRDAAGFGAILPGEVLVAPYTNPSWTPLFGRVAAVVVDTGSAVSHAAIVAREYAIPAVMGTGDGTRRLVDGQWVRVDGDRGLVLRAEAGSAGDAALGRRAVVTAS